MVNRRLHLFGDWFYLIFLRAFICACHQACVFIPDAAFPLKVSTCSRTLRPWSGVDLFEKILYVYSHVFVLWLITCGRYVFHLWWLFLFLLVMTSYDVRVLSFGFAASYPVCHTRLAALRCSLCLAPTTILPCCSVLQHSGQGCRKWHLSSLYAPFSLVSWIQGFEVLGSGCHPSMGIFVIYPSMEVFPSVMSKISWYSFLMKSYFVAPFVPFTRWGDSPVLFRSFGVPVYD